MKVKYNADFSAQLNYKDGASFNAGYSAVGGNIPKYTGEYEVTPTQQTQTLLTEGLKMTANVVVNPIPSNYGLITYNGSVITVS